MNQPVDMEELMRTWLAANDGTRREALRVLRGERDFEIKQRAGPLLLGMGAAAKYLGVSRSTLWRVLNVGRLKKVELFPGSYRVRREDLEHLVDTTGLVAGDANACGVGNRAGRGRPKKRRNESPGDPAQPGVNRDGV